VRRSPAFGEIGAPGRKAITISDRVKPLLTHKGFELGEPLLLFSNRGASNTVKDTHPIRGMSQNRPYDFSLTQRGLAPSVRLGVVSPLQDAQALRAYLQSARDRHEPGKTERDYLLDFPGFEAAYGLPFEIPEPGSAGWCTFQEPTSAEPKAASRQVAHHITQAIANLQSGFGPGVVLVFFPTRLDYCRGYSDETEQFDVHNFVKAFCVQRGISTQFLEQATLSDAQRCRVWWWLSLALYVKTMRTPWLLDALDKSSAFVGLGFSYDRGADGQKRVVLGCSHLYSARGEGLQYRLGRIDNPIFRNKNPHMSMEDARRAGETIRQLFFESQQQLPARVVIHKRTPFLAEEKAGLLEGLAGVKQVEMLELTIDPALRYVASVARPNGTFDEDNFPVRRGTVLKLDDFSALLWVHGSTDALKAGWRYFQGKRRIPTPLAIKRHLGNSDLRLLAEEILGLSKMDWNSFDLYSKFPATLSSSNTIARIGALLGRFEPTTYDYRLFI
jgi:hypothetical protein